MKCFNCGCDLSEKDFCTSCGTDVALYKKIIHISNMFYNDGLEKANVRDLTGAVVSLRQSLKFNKNNIEARNLLGLVYFEMGEAVAAMSEWVISKNFRLKKNIADDYINALQSNPARLDTINQTIKKYNQALTYCLQESTDLAIIQLKKVLSLNPNMVQAHQLLGLIYINNEEWEKAQKELLKCCKIDRNNTMTLRYLKEVNHMLEKDESSGMSKKEKVVTEDVITYQSGNETIIQPLTVKEPKVPSALLNIAIGLVIGLAVACFLIMPASVQSAKAEMKEELKVVSDNSDAKSATISDLEQKVATLEEEKTALTTQVEAFTGTNGTMQSVDALLLACSYYMDNPNDLDKLRDTLLQVDTAYVDSQASETYKQVYSKIMTNVGPAIADSLYDTGYTAEKQEDYTTAIDSLLKAWYFDKTNSDILYQLAQSYRLAEDAEKAKTTYQQVVDLFPGTENATKSQEYLKD